MLRLTANMVVRLLAGLLPFLLAGGLVYWALLRRHGINYYLSARPPAFWIAFALASLLALALAALLVWPIARWALALPLVLFEKVSPRPGSRRERQGYRASHADLHARQTRQVAPRPTGP